MEFMDILDKTNNPIVKFGIKNSKACFTVSCPLASILYLVLYTLESISLSIISLIMHPAALIVILPAKKTGAH